jgi:hypothetical protein
VASFWIRVTDDARQTAGVPVPQAEERKLVQTCQTEAKIWKIWGSYGGDYEDGLWDVTTHSLVDIYQRFGGTYCLHLQGRRIGRSWKQWYAYTCKERTRTEALGESVGVRRTVKVYEALKRVFSKSGQIGRNNGPEWTGGWWREVRRYMKDAPTRAHSLWYLEHSYCGLAWVYHHILLLFPPR